MSSNPFLRTSEEAIQRNRLLAKNQQEVNEVSQPYFYRQVQKVEQPPIEAKIVKAIEEASNKAVLSDKFISKQLFNRNTLIEQGLLNNEKRDDLASSRTSPAIDPNPVIHRLPAASAPPLLIELPLTSRINRFINSLKTDLGRTKVGADNYKTTVGEREKPEFMDLRQIQLGDPEEFTKAINRSGMSQPQVEFAKTRIFH